MREMTDGQFFIRGKNMATVEEKKTLNEFSIVQGHFCDNTVLQK